MKKPLKQKPTFVKRTYRGGKLLRDFLGMVNATDDFYPEDWISSFTEAKNKEYVPNEGITRVEAEAGEGYITEVIKKEDFGQGRNDGGVLIKLLDSAERLGIQVHPTKAYAKSVFGSDYGKTECWHILGTREINGQKPCIYIGFKEHVTKTLWKELFDNQDVCGMLDAMHCFEVKAGETVLVTGGTPHAIGAGCFMLEIQEPSDYTMRVEKTTVAGEKLTDMQVHYGVGEEAMLDCFEYRPLTREQARKEFFFSERNSERHPVTYKDTPCFALDRVNNEKTELKSSSFFTAVILNDGGTISCNEIKCLLKKGDKYFICADTSIVIEDAQVLICHPPRKE